MREKEDMSRTELTRHYAARFHALSVEAHKDGFCVVYALAGSKGDDVIPNIDGGKMGNPLTALGLSELLRDDLKRGLDYRNNT